MTPARYQVTATGDRQLGNRCLDDRRETMRRGFASRKARFAHCAPTGLLLMSRKVIVTAWTTTSYTRLTAVIYASTTAANCSGNE